MYSNYWDSVSTNKFNRKTIPESELDSISLIPSPVFEREGIIFPEREEVSTALGDPQGSETASIKSYSFLPGYYFGG